MTVPQESPQILAEIRTLGYPLSMTYMHRSKIYEALRKDRYISQELRSGQVWMESHPEMCQYESWMPASASSEAGVDRSTTVPGAGMFNTVPQ